MATSSLNAFLNNTAIIATTNATVYTTPTAKTGVVLLAQVSNVNTSAYTNCTFWLAKSAGASTELVSNFPVPPNDALNVLTGKLVLMSGDSLVCRAASNNNLKVVISVLETQL